MHLYVNHVHTTVYLCRKGKMRAMDIDLVPKTEEDARRLATHIMLTIPFEMEDPAPITEQPYTGEWKQVVPYSKAMVFFFGEDL